MVSLSSLRRSAQRVIIEYDTGSVSPRTFVRLAPILWFLAPSGSLSGTPFVLSQPIEIQACLPTGPRNRTVYVDLEELSFHIKQSVDSDRLIGLLLKCDSGNQIESLSHFKLTSELTYMRIGCMTM